MYSRYGSVSTVWDNFATFQTPMSRAYGDRSNGSTEPKSVPHGRVSATAFSPAIASELRLKSECRKLSHGTQTPACAGNYLPSAEPCAMAHTNPGPRTKHGDKDGIHASADILAIVKSGGGNTTVLQSNLVEQARGWQGSDTSSHQLTSVLHTALRGASNTHPRRGYGPVNTPSNRDLSPDRGSDHSSNEQGEPRGKDPR